MSTITSLGFTITAIDKTTSAFAAVQRQMAMTQASARAMNEGMVTSGLKGEGSLKGLEKGSATTAAAMATAAGGINRSGISMASGITSGTGKGTTALKSLEKGGATTASAIATAAGGINLAGTKMGTGITTGTTKGTSSLKSLEKGGSTTAASIATAASGMIASGGKMGSGIESGSSKGTKAFESVKGSSSSAAAVVATGATSMVGSAGRSAAATEGGTGRMAKALRALGVPINGTVAALAGMAGGAGTSFGRATAAAEGGGRGMQKFAVGTKAGMAIAGGAIVGIALLSASKFEQIVMETVKLQRIMGGTFEQVSALRFAFQRLGIPVDVAARAIGIFSKNIVNGQNALSKNSVTLQENIAKLRLLESQHPKNAAAAARLHLQIVKLKDAIDGHTKSLPPAVRALNSLGVSATNVHGQMKPMHELLLEVSDKFKAMPPGPQKSAEAIALFGRNGLALLPFLNKGKDGIEALEKQAKKLGVTVGTDDVKATLADIKAKREFKAQVDGLEMSIGRNLVPTITKLVTGLGSVLRVLGPAAPLILAAAAAMWVLNAALMADPIVLIIMAIIGILALLAFAIDKLVTHWTAVWNAVKKVAMEVWDFLGSKWGWFLLLFFPIGTFAALAAHWQQIWGVIKLVGSAVWDFLKTAWTTVVNVFSTAWQAVSGALTGAWNATWNALKATAQAIWDAMKAAWNAVVQAFATVWSAVSSALTGAWNAVWNALKATAQAVWDAMKAAWSAVVQAFSTVWTTVSSALTAAWNAVWNALKATAQAIWDAMKAAWNAIVQAFSTVWTTVSSALSAAWNTFWNAMKTVATAIWNALKAAWQAFADGVRAIYNAFSSAMQSSWNAFWGFIKDVANAAWGLLKGSWQAFYDFVRGIFNSFAGAMKTSWDAFWGFIKTVANGAWTALKSSWNAFYDFVQKLFNTFSDAMKKGWDLFWGALKKVAQTGIDGIKSIWNGLKAIFRDPINAVIKYVINDGVLKIWNSIFGIFGGAHIPNVPEVPKFATGGPIDGPGTGTSDSIMARVSAGEHVWTANEVTAAGGHEKVAAMRSAVMGGERVRTMGPKPSPLLNGRFANNRFPGFPTGGGVPPLPQNPLPGIGPNAGGQQGAGNAPGATPPPGGVLAVGGSPFPNGSGTGWADSVFSALEKLALGGVIAVVKPMLNTMGSAGKAIINGIIPGSPPFEKAADNFIDKGIKTVIDWIAARDIAATMGGDTAGAQKWADAQIGKPYQLGGFGSTFDCSSFMSGIASIILGKAPAPMFTTFAFTGAKNGPATFEKDLKAPFMVGVENRGIGHMAGTLNGKNYEATPPKLRSGPGARGAMDPLFDMVYGMKASAGGGTIPTGDHLSIITSALKAAGVPPPGSLAEWEKGLNTLITRESTWNAGAKNPSGATGLAQVMPGTFAAFHVAGMNNILDPVANVAAAIRYIVATYGTITKVQQANPALPPKGYASGTDNATPGMHLVGENGPELVAFGGGEKVIPNSAFGGGGSSGGDVADLANKQAAWMSYLQAIQDQSAQTWASVKDSQVTNLGAITARTAVFTHEVPSSINDAGVEIDNTWRTAWNRAKTASASSFTQMATGTTGFTTDLKRQFLETTTSVGHTWKTAWDKAKTDNQTDYTAITTATTTFTADLKKQYTETGAAVGLTWKTMWDKAKTDNAADYTAMTTATTTFWTGTKKAFTDGTTYMTGTFQPAIDNVMTKQLPASFATSVSDIGTAWVALKTTVRDPVAAVVDIVYNKGIVGVWNLIATAFGAKTLAAFTMPGFATGGAVDGPGTATSDSIVARLSAGEHVWTAAEVAAAGGHGAVAKMRSHLVGGAAREMGHNGRFQAGGGVVGPGGSATGTATSPATGAAAAGAGASLSTLPLGSIGAKANPLIMAAAAAGDAAVKAMFQGTPDLVTAIVGMSDNMAKTVTAWITAHDIAPVALTGGGNDAAAQAWADAQVGKPYALGGNFGATFDCSQYMSGIARVILGQAAAPWFTTFAFNGATAPPGFAQNSTAPFMVGVTNAGVGHMAGTLNGKNYEATPPAVRSGPAARGASNSMFPMHYGFTPSVAAAGGGSAVGILGNHLATIDAALAAAGIPPPNTKAQWESGMNTLITRESGWNPNAINLTDSNAAAGHPSQGLAQLIPATFAAYHVAGTSSNILDPVANIAAACRYIVARYGSILNVQQANPNLPPLGYEMGTNNATRGWHMIDEDGAEWINFRGGEKVLPNGQVPRWNGHDARVDHDDHDTHIEFHDGAFQFDCRGATKEAITQIETNLVPKLRMAVQAGVGKRCRP